MDLVDPCHDEEADGVLFEVAVRGRRAQGYISCTLLRALDGPAAASPASDSAGWVAAYRRHQARIDAVVLRRAAAEGWETVMLHTDDLAEPPDPAARP